MHTDIYMYKYRNLFESEVKGSSAPIRIIFEIKVGKSRIRHRTTLELNDASQYRRGFYVGSEAF